MTEQETQASIKTGVCSACGADVRPDTAFCYNCGESLEAHRTPDAVYTEKIEVSKNGTEKSDLPMAAGPGLRSAASIRKRPKLFEREPIKIAWLPAEENADLGLIVSAGVILFLALIAVGLALYYK